MDKIIFVCTGNTCRSPIAEAIWQKICLDRGIANLKAESCGVHATLGTPINRTAQLVLQEIGIECSHHARPFQTDMSDSQSLIILMTGAHKKYFPDRQVWTLGELTDGRDVEDPFLGDEESYRRVRDQLLVQLPILLEKLLAK